MIRMSTGPLGVSVSAEDQPQSRQQMGVLTEHEGSFLLLLIGSCGSNFPPIDTFRGRRHHVARQVEMEAQRQTVPETFEYAQYVFLGTAYKGQLTLTHVSRSDF